MNLYAVFAGVESVYEWQGEVSLFLKDSSTLIESTFLGTLSVAGTRVSLKGFKI